MLEKISHTGPSLAVKFYKEWCFCSQGPFLEVYEYATGRKINRCQMFHRNKVHGIQSNEESGKVLVYGAGSVSYVHVNDLLSNTQLLKNEKNLGEWVVSGEFSCNEDEIYLLTIYNKVLTVRPEDMSVLSAAVLDGECSILYSGSIKTLSDRVLIIAGTVIHGIIVWDLSTRTLIHSLQGHAGAVFYVAASGNGKLLASCSDDRSIKLWNMETGALITTAWGHTARIWNLKFFSNDTKLISVSEDCTCRVWCVADSEMISKNVYEVHLTKNVWGIDVEQNNLIAVTSGNDGRLKITELGTTESDKVSTFTLEKISEQCDQFVPTKNEIVKGFHWFDFGLVMITSEGNILRYLELSDKWDFLDHDSRFFSFSITNGFQSRISFMNNKCLLRFLNFDQNGSVIDDNELILDELSNSLNCLKTQYRDTDYLFIESPNLCDPLLVLKLDDKSIKPTGIITLMRPESLLSTSVNIHGDYLLAGGRSGQVFLFDLRNRDTNPIIINTPGTDAITSISHVETNDHGDLFSVTNRDGSYVFIAFMFNEMSCKIVHTSKINRGLLEGSFYDPSGDLIVYGFKSNMFQIFNETQQYETFSQVCGGSHRQWKFFNYQKCDKVLCFVKNSTLNIVKIPNQKYSPALKNGTHGREIRDLSFQSRQTDKKDVLFVSGSEDTTVKLTSLNIESGTIRNVWTLKDHVSGLQRCKFLNDTLFVTCSAREELYLWELNYDFSSPYVCRKQKLVPSMTNPDLRIMDFDVLFLTQMKDAFILVTVYSDSSIKVWFYSLVENKFTLLINGKYTDCCILNVSFIVLKASLLLLIAATDGHLTFWDITTLSSFKVQGGQVMKLIMNTTPAPLPKCAQTIQIHSAGIKCIDTRSDLESNSFKVYTGGDDNAVGITKFTLTPGKYPDVQRLAFDPYAASSTLTSIKLIDNAAKILTTSIDQIIRIRDVSNDTLDLVEEGYTTVADTGSSDVIELASGETLLLVGGAGLSCWKSS